MHRALWKLYRLRIRGGFRSMFRKVQSVRGAALALFALVVIGLMFGPNLVMAVRLGHAGVLARNADAFHELIPVVMLLYVILTIASSMGERAIYFSPSDVDFLFPGPFSRRELLLYKILGTVTAAIYIALVMATSLIVHIRSWPAAAVGFFLAWLMINSLCMCAQLIAQSVGERIFTRARKLLLGGVVVAVAIALGQAASRGLQGAWQQTLLEARHSPVAEIVLAPFAVFANVISAERLFPDALGWALLGASLVVGVYALAMRLDANYLETAVRVSQQMQQRRRRVMSEGAFARHSKHVVRSSRLPQPPWLGGVGPLAWRQVIQVLRGSRGAMVLIAIVAVAVSVPALLGARRDGELLKILPGIIIGASAYVTFLFSAQAPLGFRGDYERMELLKSLPIGPIAMACGQTLVVTLIVTVIQTLIFVVAAILLPNSAGILLLAALFALPFNWVLFGAENFLFLLYPSPLVATGSEGFLKMGRVMLFMLVKSFALLGCSVVAGVPAVGIFLLTESLPAAFLIAGLALIFPLLGILLAIAWAYHRYDGSAALSE